MKRLDDFIQSLSDEQRKILADKLNTHYINININVNPEIDVKTLSKRLKNDFDRYDRLRGV
jgi:hypothetical protein